MPVRFTESMIRTSVGMSRHTNEAYNVLQLLVEHKAIRYFRITSHYSINGDYMKQHLIDFINQDELNLNDYFNKKVFDRSTEISVGGTTEILAGISLGNGIS
jgi:hypothetical protein